MLSPTCRSAPYYIKTALAIPDQELPLHSPCSPRSSRSSTPQLAVPVLALQLWRSRTNSLPAGANCPTKSNSLSSDTLSLSTNPSGTSTSAKKIEEDANSRQPLPSAALSQVSTGTNLYITSHASTPRFCFCWHARPSRDWLSKRFTSSSILRFRAGMSIHVYHLDQCVFSSVTLCCMHM
jgi:hypothetical protein